MGSLGKILDPIGAIAPKRGIGRILSPATFAADKAGGKLGYLLDPAGNISGDRRKAENKREDKRRSGILQETQDKYEKDAANPNKFGV
jgi:hypothetical protein